jgi:hypothetical protein
MGLTRASQELELPRVAEERVRPTAKGSNLTGGPVQG